MRVFFRPLARGKGAFRSGLLLFFCACAWPDPPVQVPSGTRFSIRLNQTISSVTAKPGDPVSALLIAPVRVGNRELIPANLSVTGVVADADPRKRSDHSLLLLDFGRLALKVNGSLPFAAKVVEIDNARESVDTAGIIHGLRPLRRRPTEAEDILMLAAYAHPEVLASLEIGKFIVAEREKPRIHYAPLTELWLELKGPLLIQRDQIPAVKSPGLDHDKGLADLVKALPLRTAASGDCPSDLINIAFAGSEAALAQAFTDAGWSTAADLDLKTEAATFFAVAIHHSYREGPVSTLRLNGALPARVYEKSLNTYSKRHHIRIWHLDRQFEGVPVWVGAASHDTGIDFSRKTRTFSHSVASDIDAERQKVMDDLTLTGRVSGAALVNRADAPQTFRNATGDQLHTDGAIAVLRLRN